MFALPLFSSATVIIDGQEFGESNECCQLKHTITIGYTPFHKGEIVQGRDDAICSIGSGGQVTPYWSGLCLLDSVMTFSETILWISLAAVAVGIIAAGIVYVSAGGNAEMIKKAHQVFKYSLIGVLISVLSQFIPGLVRYFIGI